ncbi:MAG TPA: hypothetical protein VN812_09510, partial [Candidatus Acidoferrales bacterium]|nr:hypothetical protein [Candidatus Acidoferrales bacterium]
MLTSVVLCERADHVRRARAQAPDAALVALTPEATWVCQQEGLLYRKLDEFCSDAGINELAEATLGREYRWAKWLDAALQEAVPEFAAERFEPARAHLLLLRRIVDNFVLPACYLQSFVAAAQPRRVIVFERPPFCPDLMAAPRERPLFALLAPVIAAGQAEVVVWPEAPDAPGIQETTGTAVRPRRILARRIARRLQIELSFAGRNLVARRGRVAWIGHEYGLVFVVPHLQRAGIAVIRPSPSVDFGARHQTEAQHVRALLDQHWPALSEHSEFWQPLDAVSPALRPSATPLLRQWLLERVPQAWAEFLGAREWLRQGRFVAVMGVDAPAAGLAGSIYMAAGSLGIPRILNMHMDGGMCVDFKAQDSVGPVQGDIYLVSSSEDIEYFEGFNERANAFRRAKVVPVGSPRLEALRTARNERHAAALRRRILGRERKPLILYVPTNFVGCYRYFNEGNISDVGYFELQQRILRCCAEFPNVRVVYKPFPGEYSAGPVGEFIRRSVPNGIAIDTRL